MTGMALGTEGEKTNLPHTHAQENQTEGEHGCHTGTAAACLHVHKLWMHRECRAPWPRPPRELS